jgi:hypothetical protein
MSTETKVTWQLTKNGDGQYHLWPMEATLVFDSNGYWSDMHDVFDGIFLRSDINLFLVEDLLKGRDLAEGEKVILEVKVI